MLPTSSAIPLERRVLRTRPLRGQSRYYPNFLGHDAEEWWSFDHSSASSKDHSPKPKISLRDFLVHQFNRIDVLAWTYTRHRRCMSAD